MTTKKGWRPYSRYVDDALVLIERTARPLSTLELASAIGLNRNQTVTLRRGLNREAETGRVLKVGSDDRDSYLWAVPPRRCQRGDLESACWSAAYAAEQQLRRALPAAQVDVLVCFAALKAALGGEQRVTEQQT